uniref:Uncharacterized protein n=1 Tax=Aegilops tauschii TaxID=37682 RepID=M8CIT3_AEGTA
MGPTSLGGGGAPSAVAHAHGGTSLNRCCHSAVLESPSTAAVVWLSLCYGYNLPLWNNLELENFKDKINEVTGVMAVVYGGDHKFFDAGLSCFFVSIRTKKSEEE